MTSAPAAEEVHARLQAVQDELAQKFNVAIAIRDRHGQPLTTPSKSVEQKASLSASALQGLYHCLSSNWLLRDQDALQGKRLVATLFSGGVAVAALPMMVDSEVAAVVRVAQTFGEVRRKLELLNEQVVSSGGAISSEDFIDPVDIHLGAHFVAMLEAIEQAVGEVLGVAPVAPPPEAPGALPPLPATERLLSIIPAGAFVATVDWQISAANQELARMLGYADGQALVGRNLLGELMDLEFLPLLEELQGKDEIVARQVRLRAADGGELPAILSMAAMESKAGAPPTYLGVVQRTERGMEGPSAPALAPAQLEALVESWPAPALLVDSSQRILRHSRAVEQELGYAAGELAGAQLQSVLAGTEGVFAVAETSPSPVPQVLDMQFFHKSGDRTEARCVAVPAAGAVAFLVLSAPSAPGVRLEAGDLLSSLVARLPFASLVCTGDGRILHANVASAALTGYTEEELLGRPLAELVASDEQANVADWLSDARAGQLVDTRLTVSRKDGTLAEVGARMFAVHGENRTPFVVVTLQEAARRSDAEGDQCYRQLVEASRDLYWAIEIPDPEHFELAIPLQLSRGFADIPDLATLKAEGGLVRAKITHTPESWETFRRSCLAVLRTGRVMSGVRTVHVDREGKVVQTFLTEILPLYREGKLVGVHGLARDTTQEYLLQQELRRSEEKY
ncbi:MAG: PAS domain S-box protein, partial [Calditrichaeota bacterium]|nr:PAS domain S-box protein [Calditrichota bacterium]